MLTVDPKKRIPIDGIINHPWVRDRGAHPRRKAPEVCRLKQEDILPDTEQYGRDKVIAAVMTSSQETVKKPLTSILKKSQRRASDSQGSENGSPFRSIAFPLY